MRRQLIEALTYPRLLIRQLTEAGACPHANLYEATGERCSNCDGKSDCTWTNCLQDFREFEYRDSEFLAHSLREGIRLVEALHSELHHDETTCTCETCSWIRDAEHLAEEMQHHLPHAEHAVPAEQAEKATAEQT